MGEVGRTADLSAFSPLKGALTRALSSSSEDIKGCASLALGAVCIGNLTAYLPFLLQAIQDQASALLAASAGASAELCGGRCWDVPGPAQLLL